MRAPRNEPYDSAALAQMLPAKAQVIGNNSPGRFPYLRQRAAMKIPTAPVAHKLYPLSSETFVNVTLNFTRRVTAMGDMIGPNFGASQLLGALDESVVLTNGKNISANGDQDTGRIEQQQKISLP